MPKLTVYVVPHKDDHECFSRIFKTKKEAVEHRELEFYDYLSDRADYFGDDFNLDDMTNKQQANLLHNFDARRGRGEQRVYHFEDSFDLLTSAFNENRGGESLVSEKVYPCTLCAGSGRFNRDMARKDAEFEARMVELRNR